MAMQLDGYLNFEGNCEEALNFYVECLGGQVTAPHRYDAMPQEEGFKLPAGWDRKVMHGTVEAEGAQIMASDVPPAMGGGGKFGGFSVSVWGQAGRRAHPPPWMVSCE